MLGMGDKKKLAMIIIGKKPMESSSPTSSDEFVEKVEGDKKESIQSEESTALDDAMDAFLVAVEAKDRAKAVKSFKDLVSLCDGSEEQDDEEEMM